MSEERGKGDHSETPLSNTLSSNDKYLPDEGISMMALPDKMEKPSIPHFREKPVQILVDGFCLIFKSIMNVSIGSVRRRKKVLILCSGLSLEILNLRNFIGCFLTGMVLMWRTGNGTRHW